jgi:hypothetical protein
VREVALMLPAFVLVVWMGVAPNTFIAKSAGSLDAVQRRLDQARVSLVERQAEKVAVTKEADGR